MRGQSSTEPENRPATTAKKHKTAGRVLAAGSAAALLTATGAGLSAQENGGLELTFGIRSQLRATDNAELSTAPLGDALLWDTTLSFGLRSVTRRSVLDFGISGVARLADLPAGANGGNGFEDPTLRLSYTLDNSNSRLEAKANWQRTDLSYLSPINDPVLVLDDAGDLVLINDPGSRTRYGYSATLETGINAPLGLTVSLDHRGFEYQDTISTAYADSKRTRVTGKLRFDLAPDTQAYLRARHADFESDNALQTHRVTRTLTLGMAHEADAATTYDINVGYAETTVDTTGGRTVSEGITAEASAARQLQNGSAGLSYEHSVGVNGSRNSLKMQREMELPRGKLSFDMGVSKASYGSVQMVGSMRYDHALAMGGLNVSVGRSVSTDADNTDIIATRINAGWSYDLSALSSLSLNAGLIRVEDAGAGGYATRDRSNLTIAYNHALTEDWMMSTGVERRTSQTAGQPQATSNAIFFSLERDFKIRP